MQGIRPYTYVSQVAKTRCTSECSGTSLTTYLLPESALTVFRTTRCSSWSQRGSRALQSNAQFYNRFLDGLAHCRAAFETGLGLCHNCFGAPLLLVQRAPSLAPPGFANLSRANIPSVPRSALYKHIPLCAFSHRRVLSR